MSSFKDLRIVDNFYQTSAFFPMPTLLISTLDEVLQIQTEGAQKRAAAEVELRRIEGELKQKLLQARGG